MDARIKRTSWMFRILILILSGLVAYDAWVYQTPLYYLLFAFVGALAGRLYRFAYKVKHDKETGKFTMDSNVLTIVLSLGLILFRFFYAEKVLESMHVRWVNDGIYLLLIGLNWSKLKVISQQVEDSAIELFRSRNTKNPNPGPEGP